VNGVETIYASKEVILSAGSEVRTMLVGPIVSPGCIMPKIGLAVNGIRMDRESHHHGEHGPLKVGWPQAMTNSSVLPQLDETFQQLGPTCNLFRCGHLELF
jgi:hypothetical protein